MGTDSEKKESQEKNLKRNREKIKISKVFREGLKNEILVLKNKIDAFVVKFHVALQNANQINQNDERSLRK